MATTLDIKRKNIDLPTETLRKLSVIAASYGMSLKKYIESVLMATADSIKVEVTENPSPSGDSWFENPENMKEYREAVVEMKTGEGKPYSLEEIKSGLGL
ncbi:MAG: hypothetical protein K2M29_06145 [Paramuribaculum sp.]|nr:hypothetical protein [Paramuribaculum sp.]